MADIKEATANAMAFAVATLGPERTRGLRLEEIESTTVGREDAWLITLSMHEDFETFADVANNVLGKRMREYKTFTVLKHNGEVTSMKIRELADA